MGGHVVGEELPILPPANGDESSVLGGSPSASVHACMCEPGFGGPACETPQFLCPSNCSGAGLCAAATFPPSGAGIPTYVGDRREASTRSIAPTCLCQRGFAGAACEVRKASCPNDCSGHGTCKTSTFAGVTTSTCTCAPGYFGNACEEMCDGACSGRGQCTRVGRDVNGVYDINGLMCLCESGWQGAQCEHVAKCPTAIKGTVCSGNGQCAAGLCSCALGFLGHNCATDGRDREERISTCPGQCSGHGACVKGLCACSAGFAGEACEEQRAFLPV